MIIEPKIVIFDVGNVLVGHDNKALANALALECQESGCAEAFLIDLLSTTDISSGRVQVGSVFRALRERYRFQPKFEEFKKIWCCHFSNISGIDNILVSLIRNLRVVALSNTNSVHWDYLCRKYELLWLLDARYPSHEIGYAKPARGAYEFVLSAENLGPDQAVFVDDRDDNVATASSIGIHSIRFTSVDNLVYSLRDVGLLV